MIVCGCAGIHNVCDRRALCWVSDADVVTDDRRHGLHLGSSASVHRTNAAHHQWSVGRADFVRC